MGFFLALLYGLISGISEFLPISSQAHQALFMQICGVPHRLPILDLCVHIGMLTAAYYTNHALLMRLRREKQIRGTRRRSSGRLDSAGTFDSRLVKSATVPMLILMLLYLITAKYEFDPVPLSAFLVINGAVLLIPEYMRHGNKDARSMTALDGIFLGIFSSVSFLPGISRIGAGISYSTGRCADRQNAINWAMLLSMPALLLLIVFDFINLASFGACVDSFADVAGCIFAMVTSFVGSYLAIMGLRYLADRAGFTGFAYYSWGVALFTFGLYLII